MVVTVTALDNDNDDETMIESLTSKPRSVDYCRLVNQTVFFVRDTHTKKIFGQWSKEKGPSHPLVLYLPMLNQFSTQAATVKGSNLMTIACVLS